MVEQNELLRLAEAQPPVTKTIQRSKAKPSRGPNVNRLVILCSANCVGPKTGEVLTPLKLRHSLVQPLSAASTPRTQMPHCHCAPAWKPKMALLSLVLKSALCANGPTAVGVGKCWLCWYHTPPMLPPT